MILKGFIEKLETDCGACWHLVPVVQWTGDWTSGAKHPDSSWTVPLTGGRRWNPPSFDLAQLRVRNLDLEGQPGDPHVELQLSTQVAIGEVHHHPHFALHLLAIDEDIVAPVRHLRARGAEDLQAAFKSAPLIAALADDTVNYTLKYAV